MTTEIVFQDQATEDLSHIITYYESKQKGLGKRFFDCVSWKLSKIRYMPQSFPVFVGDYRRAIMNRFPFSIYFRIYDNKVFISAIIHQRQNLDSLDSIT